MLEKDNNHDLHRYISESGLYYFRVHMINKSHEYETELRLANRYFASSKKCSCCGHRLKSLTLNDRVYKCPNCGYEFSLTMDCPYLGFGGICDETHKFCRFRNEDHLKCETWLKKQD